LNSLDNLSGRSIPSILIDFNVDGIIFDMIWREAVSAAFEYGGILYEMPLETLPNPDDYVLGYFNDK
jgi:hypothetical protein